MIKKNINQSMEKLLKYVLVRTDVGFLLIFEPSEDYLEKLIGFMEADDRAAFKKEAASWAKMFKLPIKDILPLPAEPKLSFEKQYIKFTEAQNAPPASFYALRYYNAKYERFKPFIASYIFSLLLPLVPLIFGSAYKTTSFIMFLVLIPFNILAFKYLSYRLKVRYILSEIILSEDAAKRRIDDVPLEECENLVKKRSFFG